MFGWLRKRWRRARSWVSTRLSRRHRQGRAERKRAHAPTAENGDDARVSSSLDQKRLSASDANGATMIAEPVPLNAALAHHPSSEELNDPTNPVHANDMDKANDDTHVEDVDHPDGVNKTGEATRRVGNATEPLVVDGHATLVEKKVVAGLESVPEGESSSFAPAPTVALPPMANGSAALNVTALVRSPRKRAVLIGIHYTNHIIAGWDKLETPGDDVKKMESFLRARQYTEMRILMDKPDYIQPTADAIRDALRWLVEDAREGDKLFLHYAGHGSQVKSDTLSEADGMDELIVPLCLEGEETQIIDNELHEILVKPIPGGCSLVTLFDCCHAGTMLDLPKEFPPNFKERIVNTIPFLKKASTLRHHPTTRRLTVDDASHAQKDYELREETEARLKAEILKRKAADRERRKKAIKAKGTRRASVMSSRQLNPLKLPETEMRDASAVPTMQYGDIAVRKTQTPRSTIDVSQPTSAVQKADGARISFEQPSPLAKVPTYESTKSAGSGRRRSIVKWLVGSSHPESMTSPIEDETISTQPPFVPPKTDVILAAQPDPGRSKHTKTGSATRHQTLHVFEISEQATEAELKPDITSVAACLDSELAIDKNDLGGILTDVFIRCFEDRPKEFGDRITLGELREYMREQFKRLTASLHEDCKPAPGMTDCPECELPLIPPNPLVTSNVHLNRDKMISI